MRVEDTFRQHKPRTLCRRAPRRHTECSNIHELAALCPQWLCRRVWRDRWTVVHLRRFRRQGKRLVECCRHARATIDHHSSRVLRSQHVRVRRHPMPHSRRHVMDAICREWGRSRDGHVLCTIVRYHQSHPLQRRVERCRWMRVPNSLGRCRMVEQSPKLER